MSADSVTIAEAMVTALNGGSFSLSFMAERSYVPVRRLEDLGTLRVTVVPSGRELEILDRSRRAMVSHSIDVGVQQRIGTGTMTEAQILAACDPLAALVEEISDFLQYAPLAVTDAVCTEVRNAPIYSPQHIDERRVFTSVLTFVYQLPRVAR